MLFVISSTDAGVIKIDMPDLDEIENLKSALHLANERLAIAASISKDALVGVMPDGRITIWNHAAERLYCYAENDAIGKSIMMLTTPDGREEQLTFLSRVYAGETVAPYETRHLRKDGSLIDVSFAAAPVKSIQGSVESVMIVVQDIGQRKDWEFRQRSMTRELAHRVKNSFAILQSILYSTLKTSPQPKDFAKVFSSRLHSLAASQDILTAHDWRGVELGALVRHQLASYDKLDGVKLRITGPEVCLASHYAIPFGLIFNELAANAYQHGAWSTPIGKVELSWHVEHKNDAVSKLHLIWQEQGGPKPSSRRSPGLGVVLIEKGLAGAKVVNTYEEYGLTCTIELEFTPLSGLNQF